MLTIFVSHFLLTHRWNWFDMCEQMITPDWYRDHSLVRWWSRKSSVQGSFCLKIAKCCPFFLKIHLNLIKLDPPAGIPRIKIEVLSNVKSQNSFSRVIWNPWLRLFDQLSQQCTSKWVPFWIWRKANSIQLLLQIKKFGRETIQIETLEHTVKSKLSDDLALDQTRSVA